MELNPCPAVVWLHPRERPGVAGLEDERARWWFAPPGCAPATQAPRRLLLYGKGRRAAPTLKLNGQSPLATAKPTGQSARTRRRHPNRKPPAQGASGEAAFGCWPARGAGAVCTYSRARASTRVHGCHERRTRHGVWGSSSSDGQVYLGYRGRVQSRPARPSVRIKRA